jgi:malonyl-CoA/methylmalonyl-CoA synthetase
LPGVELRLVSPEGNTVPPGEIGEVLVQGENVFKGYWRMPEKTAEAVQEGWLRSGDLGYQDPEDDLRLYLVGRSKELIISGGLNVYPKEVESALERYEAVEEAAVFGLPDEDLGEKVSAAVVLREGVSPPGPEELLAFARQYLTGYKCPRKIFFLDSLPKNAMGKVQKDELRKMVS